MRIDFRIDGGLAAFPGLSRPVSIECDTLPPAEHARLRALVERAGLLAERAPAPVERSSRTADARTYTIVVDDGPRCRTVTVREPIADPALRELVGALRDRARATLSR